MLTKVGRKGLWWKMFISKNVFNVYKYEYLNNGYII